MAKLPQFSDFPPNPNAPQPDSPGLPQPPDAPGRQDEIQLPPRPGSDVPEIAPGKSPSQF